MEKELWLSKLIEVEEIEFTDTYKDWISYAIFCRYGFIVAKEVKDGDIWKGIVYGRYDSSDPNILPKKHSMEMWLSKLDGIKLKEIM